MKRPWTMAEIKRAEKLWKEGHTPRQISEIFDRSVLSIHGLAARHRDRFPRQTSGRRPISRPAIRDMVRSGFTNGEVATLSGISERSVRRIMQEARA